MNVNPTKKRVESLCEVFFQPVIYSRNIFLKLGLQWFYTSLKKNVIANVSKTYIWGIFIRRREKGV
jgi:hypothetical protein